MGEIKIVFRIFIKTPVILSLSWDTRPQLVWSLTARDRDLAYQDSKVRIHALEACTAWVQ